MIFLFSILFVDLTSLIIFISPYLSSFVFLRAELKPGKINVLLVWFLKCSAGYMLLKPCPMCCVLQKVHTVTPKKFETWRSPRGSEKYRWEYRSPAGIIFLLHRSHGLCLYSHEFSEYFSVIIFISSTSAT